MNIIQIQTITAGCQCKQEPKSRLLNAGDVQLHAQYLDEYFFKYDIWLENHLQYNRSNTLQNLRAASKLKFELAGTRKS